MLPGSHGDRAAAAAGSGWPTEETGAAAGPGQGPACRGPGHRRPSHRDRGCHRDGHRHLSPSRRLVTRSRPEATGARRPDRPAAAAVTVVGARYLTSAAVRRPTVTAAWPERHRLIIMMMPPPPPPPPGLAGGGVTRPERRGGCTVARGPAAGLDPDSEIPGPPAAGARAAGPRPARPADTGRTDSKQIRTTSRPGRRRPQ